MDIHECTANYETWLAQQLAATGGADAPAIKVKHEKMRVDVFTFLRATFYRWVQLWEVEGAAAARIAAAGDVHVENFGTWRAAGGGVACGINDFDEACVMPWHSDLVRLAVSTTLGLRANATLPLAQETALGAILAGYTEAVSTPSPSLLALAMPALLDRLQTRKSAKEFWKDEDKKLLPAVDLPASAQAALQAALPQHSTAVAHKIRDPAKPKGTGSLGRQRFFARATAGKIEVLAEAKAFAPSAMALWRPEQAEPGLREMIVRLGVLGDPTNAISGDWVIRLSTSDSVKVELDDLPKVNPTAKELELLFRWMGASLGTIHAISPNATAVAAELSALQNPTQWLTDLTGVWRQNVENDWTIFRQMPPGAGIMWASSRVG